MWNVLNKKRLVLTIVYAYILFAGLVGTTQFQDRYFRGISLVMGLLGAVLFFRSIKLLFTAEVKERIATSLAKVFKTVGRPFIFLAKKVSNFLGLERRRLYGKDEKSFIFTKTERSARKRRRLKNDQKWADQPDNVMRIRFLFTEYMIKKIRSGYIMRYSQTPCEIAEEVAHEQDDRLLFESYENARYATNISIDDQTVERLVKFTKRI